MYRFMSLALVLTLLEFAPVAQLDARAEQGESTVTMPVANRTARRARSRVYRQARPYGYYPYVPMYPNYYVTPYGYTTYYAPLYYPSYYPVPNYYYQPQNSQPSQATPPFRGTWTPPANPSTTPFRGTR